MVTTVMCTPATVGTLPYVFFWPMARHIIQENLAWALPKICASRGVGGHATSKLSAHNFSIIEPPGIITNGTPISTVKDFHKALASVRSIHQPQCLKEKEDNLLHVYHVLFGDICQHSRSRMNERAKNGSFAGIHWLPQSKNMCSFLLSGSKCVCVSYYNPLHVSQACPKFLQRYTLCIVQYANATLSLPKIHSPLFEN